MTKKIPKITEKTTHEIALFGIALITVGILVFLYQTNSKLTRMGQELASTTNSLLVIQGVFEERIQEAEQKDLELSDLLYEEQKNIEDLADNVEGFDRKVGRLSGTVDTLEKLTTTDPELLQKYSSVYFLNEHYMPADLTVIEEKYDYVNGKEVSIHSEVWPFLEELLEEAKDDGVSLLVLSGYRSFEEQHFLKESYTIQYGVGANKFSADQGYSEHQLGTTVDFTTPAVGQALSTFGGTEAHKWLVKNAHKYGFVMSYPENNEYYIYEPWHWRFVGEDLARYLERKEKYFYDLEQRKIDEYIPVLFD